MRRAWGWKSCWKHWRWCRRTAGQRGEDGTARAEAAYTAAAAEQTDVQTMETLQVALGAPAAERETEE